VIDTLYADDDDAFAGDDGVAAPVRTYTLRKQPPNVLFVVDPVTV
jgi:hypothetical protein